MNEKEEVRKLVYLNILIFFIISSIMLWLILNIKNNWVLTSHQYFRIFATSLVMPTVIFHLIKYNEFEYRTYIIRKDSNEKALLESYLLKSKVKNTEKGDKYNIYEVKNKHSFLPLKFIIHRKNGQIEIKIPNVIKKEIFQNHDDLIRIDNN